MKYFYTTLILTFLIIDLSAQARMTGNRLSVGSLTAASETIEVFGDAQITGTNPFMRFKLTDAVPSSGDESGLHWKNSTNATNMRMLYSWLDNRLYVLPDTDQNFAHLSIENSSGHVGINVRDPQEQFHVAGKMFITDDIRMDGPEYLQWEESGTRKAFVRFGGLDLTVSNEEDGGWLNLLGDDRVNFNTNGLRRMAILEDGNIGINTSAPADKLHVLAEPGEGITVSRSGAATVAIKADDPGSIGTTSNHHFRLITNNTVRVQVNKTGNVGIGTTSVTEKLQVNGAIRLGTTTGTNTGTIRYTGSDFEGRVGSSWMSLTNGGGGASVWTPSGTNAYYNSGNVGIGTNSPAHKLQVNGDIGMTGEIIGVSDIRTKTGVLAIEDASAIINKLRPVHYQFAKNKFESLDLPEGKQYGFVAQEVEKILPELVSISAETEVDGETSSLKGVNYIQMIPVLTQAMQEQHDVIQKQQDEINELKTLVRQLIEEK